MEAVRLIACPTCHAQYDVGDVAQGTIPCRCGEELENRPPQAVDAVVHRCGSCGAQVGAAAESCDFCGSAIVRDRRKLSLICPECFARNAEDSRFCTACGVAFRPEAVPQNGRELPCPCCGCLMPPRQIAGVGTNECPQCNGLWVPEDRFDGLVQRAIEARQSADPARLRGLAPRVKGSNPAGQAVEYRKCPVCEAFMPRRNFRKTSGVIVDRCREHGTWLDADELEQIAGFILSGGRPRARTVMDEADRSAERAYRQARAGAIAAGCRGSSSAFGRRHASGGESFLVGLLKELLF
ncbi:MAG: zf-TFIIB domain-containing protein [Proteobacteria bacterium]|nr:zf-TFIIB domain-containing protein [Pseudomonadota bacterium]